METEGIYRVPGVKGDIDRLRLHFSYGRPNLDDECKKKEKKFFLSKKTKKIKKSIN